MKKSIVAFAALAALSAGTAFAQSSVAISGTFDASAVNAKTTYGNGSSASQTGLRNSNQGTSQITFKGEEILGGGLKASFLLENGFDTARDGTDNFGSKGGEQYLALEGGFGKVALGAPNTPTRAIQLASNPFGSKVGSGFGSVNSGRLRQSNSVVYTSPTYNGFTAAAGYSFHNNADTTAIPAVAATASSTDLSLTYTQGPLSAGISSWRTDAVGSTASLNEVNAFGSYDMGVAKLSAGYFQQKQSLVSDYTGYNIGATVPLMANFSLFANYAHKNDQMALNQDKDIYAIGAQYTLSKRTSVYARFVDEKTDNASLTQAKDVKTTLVGLQHNF
jgi:predicted porin